MAEILIRVNRRSTDKLLRQLDQWSERQGAPGRSELLRDAGISIRDDIRAKLKGGGRGQWKPLSPWTKARTGRTKPLETLAPRVHFRTRGRGGEVYFQSTSDEWSLTSHHFGYHVRETHALMRIPQGGSGAVFLRRRRPFKVPARPVWPSERRVVTLVNQTIRGHIARLQRSL